MRTNRKPVKSVSSQLDIPPGLVATLIDIISPDPNGLPMPMVGVGTGSMGKSFGEQKFKEILPVIVKWIKNGKLKDSMIDEVKGLNKGHALYRAKENWPDAVVEEIKNLIGYSKEGSNFVPIKK